MRQLSGIIGTVALDRSSTMATRKIPDKCVRCAALSAEQAKDINNCWDSKTCPSRRSYARNRDRRNQARRRQRQERLLTLTVATLPSITYAVLVLYRETGDSPVHAIAAEVWCDGETIARVAAIHCCHLVPSQVHEYVRQMLELLGESYGVKKFASLVRLDPYLCPIDDCFLRPKIQANIGF
jgi:hypothetical protein